MARFLFDKSERFSLAGRCIIACVLLGPVVAQVALGRDTEPDPEFPGNEFVNVRLALEQTALAKQGTTNLAVIFDISPGWHLYWRNPGDSGLPPRIRFSPIKGVTFAAPQWPAPKRRVEADTLVDYVFEHQLVLIVPVTLAADYTGGENLSISAQVDWLVCKESCVRGRKTIAAKFTVADNAAPSEEAKLFAAARARFPKPVSEARDVDMKWSGRDLTIRAKGAIRLTFFPYENNENAFPADMVHEGSAKSDVLKLRYGKDVSGLKEVAGVLAIERDGAVAFHEIKLNPPKSK